VFADWTLFSTWGKSDSPSMAWQKPTEKTGDRHTPPDYIIKVRQDVLEEEDGPMLQHGLKGLNSQRIILPRNSALHPNRELLEERFERFKKAG
jgi:hypothetical protein